MSLERRNFLTGLGALFASSMIKPGDARAQMENEPVIAPQPKYHYSKPVIDAHTHWWPPEFVALIEKEGAKYGVTDIRRNAQGELECTIPGYHPYAPHERFRREMTDVDIILKEMDERSIDMYNVAQTHPGVQWARPDFGLALAQTINDATSALCVKYPKRFTGAINLVMQDVNASLYELERARKLPGMRAVHVTEDIIGMSASDRRFWPVYEAVEAANLPLILHNYNPSSEGLIQDGFSMLNTLGNPIEATVASMSFILSGALDQFPKLDLFLPHAGGALPWLVWRTDWAMGDAAYAPPRKPVFEFKDVKLPRASDYLHRFHYDLILHNPKLMRTLIDVVGLDRVTCGTDFPQGMAIMKPVEYVEAIPGLTQRECETILCDNPARLLRL